MASSLTTPIEEQIVRHLEASLQSDTAGRHTLEHLKRVTAAVSQHARWCADLTDLVIQVSGVSTPLNVPASFLQELSSAALIAYWETQGIDAHVKAGLPCFEDAMKSLEERLDGGAYEDADGAERCTLMQQVLPFWLGHFAWDGQSIMGADILLDQLDPEEYLDWMAEFLWSNRTQINKLLTAEGETQ